MTYYNNMRDRFSKNEIYVDITGNWLNSVKSKKCIILHNVKDTFTYKKNKYFIDGYNVVIDYKTGELEFAFWLATKTNKRIELFPRFNKPDHMKTADYKIGREYFDYKHTTGLSSQLIYHNLYSSKGQSLHFIVNITNDKLSEEEIKRQVEYTFRRLHWIKTIGIKSKYGFKIFKRKKQ